MGEVLRRAYAIRCATVFWGLVHQNSSCSYRDRLFRRTSSTVALEASLPGRAYRHSRLRPGISRLYGSNGSLPDLSKTLWQPGGTDLSHALVLHLQ